MKVLVLNAGSSSLKFSVTDTRARRHLTRGVVERVGSEEAVLRWNGTHPVRARDHREALEAVLERVDLTDVQAVGHRVVHGGDLTENVRIDARVLERLEAFIPLAPLHNPANLAGIRAAQALFPELPQVGVFDTAFHQTLPPEAYLYAIPYALYEAHGLRRYGFHGTSHRYVAREAARLLNRPLEELCLVTLHLGNGASATAIRFGQSVDTSMGFTPLEGLVMGTRSGDLDPGVVLELVDRFGLEETRRILNQESGLKGLSGLSHDLRDLHAARRAGDAGAERALAVYTYRIKKYVGAFAAAMGGLDALVFTGGVGENDPEVRARVVQGLEFLGLVLDPERNRAGGPCITRAESRAHALVVPTDEELAIAFEVARVLGA